MLDSNAIFSESGNALLTARRGSFECVLCIGDKTQQRRFVSGSQQQFCVSVGWHSSRHDYTWARRTGFCIKTPTYSVSGKPTPQVVCDACGADLPAIPKGGRTSASAAPHLRPNGRLELHGIQMPPDPFCHMIGHGAPLPHSGHRASGPRLQADFHLPASDIQFQPGHPRGLL